MLTLIKRKSLTKIPSHRVNTTLGTEHVFMFKKKTVVKEIKPKKNP